ncbi:MAG: CDP-alcohol phosphatidyltransferase family protein [Pseudomonadota bacterium]
MTERRPIASRNTKLAAKIARRLAARGVSPNRISRASIVFAGMAGIAFWLSGMTSGVLFGLCLMTAALGCQLRLLCNLFDGMVAVEGGRGEPDGPFWNEAPDRVADTLIFVGMGAATGAWALGWAAAAMAIGTAYIRGLGSEIGVPADFGGPMAKPQRMALATGSAVAAIFFPAPLGWPLLELALWGIVFGAALTIVLRSGRLIGALKARARD